MNYLGGKRKFPFSEYTLMCYICLDSGSKSVYILDILDMFATYYESVPLFFFLSGECIYVCMGEGYFYYLFSVVLQTSYSSKLYSGVAFFFIHSYEFIFYCLKYWCRFLNENLAGPHPVFIEHVIPYCNVLSNPIIHYNLHWTVST